MKKVLFIAGFFVVLAAGLSVAVELPQGVLEREIQTIKNTSLSQQGMMTATDDEGLDEFSTETKDDLYKYEFKSPKKAFLMSLVVPGWGQYYARSNFVKPVLMVAVEVGSWVGYIKFHNDGNKLTDEFQAFANQHWIEGDRNAVDSVNGHNYWDWYRHFAQAGDTIGGNEHLPDTKTQQYYEMIGKYDQFAGGWDDYWDPLVNPDPYADYSNLTVMTPRRALYETMRDKANTKLDHANRFIIVAMANHLLSAFDAALAANRFNKNSTGDSWLSLNAEVKKFSEVEEVPIMRLTYHF